MVTGPIKKDQEMRVHFAEKAQALLTKIEKSYTPDGQKEFDKKAKTRFDEKTAAGTPGRLKDLEADAAYEVRSEFYANAHQEILNLIAKNEPFGQAWGAKQGLDEILKNAVSHLTQEEAILQREREVAKQKPEDKNK